MKFLGFMRFCLVQKRNGDIEKLIGVAEHKQNTYYRVYHLYSFHLFSLNLEGEGGFEEVAVYSQVEFALLQFGKALGYRKPQTASLCVS